MAQAQFEAQMAQLQAQIREAQAKGEKLEADAVTREIDALTARERENGLTPAERRQLAELLLHKQKLRTRPKASDS